MTSVLAPHLSHRAEQELLTLSARSPRGYSHEASVNNNNIRDGLSAADYVSGPKGSKEDSEDDGGGNKKGRGGASSHWSTPSSAVPSSMLRDRDGQEWWEAARPRLYGFVAKYLELSLVSVGPRLTNAVLMSVAKGEVVGVSGSVVAGIDGDSTVKGHAETQARLVLACD